MKHPKLPFRAFLYGALILSIWPIAILFFIVGVVAHNMIDKDDLWIQVWLGGTVAGVFLSALNNRSNCKKEMKRTIKFLRESLQKVDYWKISRGCGVAVDVNAGKIAIEGVVNRKNVYAVVTRDQLRGIQAVTANRSEYTSIGPASSSAKAEIARMNFDEDVRAAQNTGLVFKLDDLNNPSVLVILDSDDAERWMLLFEKMFNGTLGATSTPTELPSS